MQVLGNQNPHVRKVCEYIFESEEEDFKTQVDHDDHFSEKEKVLILDYVDRGLIKIPEEVIPLLKKINHVYAYACLAYME